MRNGFKALYSKTPILIKALKEEHGQDLVEYAAIITVIVLGLIVGMGTLANGINNAMTSVSATINSSIG
jgi:Flp pilus assembly pilin Flp